MILFAVSLLLPGWGWVGETSRDIARGLRRACKFTRIFTPCCCGMYDTVYPRCVIAFAGANSHVKRAVPPGPSFRFRDVYTLLPMLCHHILLFETLKIYFNVRAKSDEISLFRKGPCEACAHGGLICCGWLFVESLISHVWAVPMGMFDFRRACLT